MKSYFVRYLTKDEESCLVVLPNWWKLLMWFLRESQRCIIIHIWVEREKNDANA